jgi:hypothetical protein
MTAPSDRKKKLTPMVAPDTSWAGRSVGFRWLELGACENNACRLGEDEEAVPLDGGAAIVPTTTLLSASLICWRCSVARCLRLTSPHSPLLTRAE